MEPGLNSAEMEAIEEFGYERAKVAARRKFQKTHGLPVEPTHDEVNRAEMSAAFRRRMRRTYRMIRATYRWVTG